MSEREEQELAERVADLEAKLGEERRKLDLTLEIGRVLVSTSGRESLYERILANVTAIMESERTTLYLLDDDGATLRSVVAQGDDVSDIKLSYGEGIAGSVAQLGRTVKVDDAYHDPRFQASVDAQSGFRTRSVLCTPLTDSIGQVIGVLQVLNKQSGAFSEGDVGLLEALAGQVAISVENSRLYQEAVSNNIELMTTSERLRKQSADIGVLLRLEREVSSALSSKDIYHRLLRAAMELVGARSGSIALLSDGGKLLRFETTAGPVADAILGRRIAVGEGVIGWAVEAQEPVIVNKPGQDERHSTSFAAELGQAPESLVCVPLVTEGEVVGAIELIDRRGGFSQPHLQLVELIAGQVARAVITARRRTKREEEDRLATIGEMMAGVLHDLRTPMTVISGYTELMAISSDEATRHGYSAQIQRQFEILNGMIREILAFARGDKDLLLTPVPLNLFFEDVETQLRPTLERRNVELKTSVEYAGSIRVDRVKLLRLVTNLANNAADAMEDSGSFSIRSELRGKDVVLEFVDDGPGIPDELEGRLFEVFARGRSGGTGLGLAIVKRIVEQHEGSISVESEQGAGTCFRVRLPVDGPSSSLDAD